MKRFQNIIFIKSADNNETALAHAIALTKHNQAKLTLINVGEKIPDLLGSGLSDEVVKRLKKTIEDGYRHELLKLVRPHLGSNQINMKILEGSPFLAIIQEVLSNGNDLVIKSAEGNEGMVSRFFNTTDMHLLRKCPCPVWLVKPEQSAAINRIVAGVDFDQQGEKGANKALNRQILEMAIYLAHRENAELHIVHAWQAMAEDFLRGGQSGLPEREVEEYVAEVKAARDDLLSKLLTEARDWVGQKIFDVVKPKTHSIKGRAEQVIVEQTRALKADLIVMGTVGRTGIPGLLIGNTAETILNGIDCSVLAVKPAGFVSPVTTPKA